MKLNALRIVEFTNPSGATVFRVDGKDKDGNRVRKNFKTKGEATAEKQRLENEIENLPTLPLVASRLTPEQIADAETAFAMLAAETAFAGKTMREAVRFYVANFKESVKPMAMRVALDKYLDEKRAANARPLTVRNLETRVGFLADAAPERLVSDVLPDHIKEIVNRPGRSPVTRGNDRRALSAFFNWAVRQEFCQRSPVEAVEVPEVDETEPVIMPLADCRKIVNAAATYKDGVVLPYVVLALFCAIRPTELARLSWDDIDLKRKEITIDGKIAKMRARRIVDIPTNAVEMLKANAKTKTPIVGKNWRRDFDAVKESAGYGTPDPKDDERKDLNPWVPDILRHTGISHHFQKHAHEGLTAKWAGNSADMIHRHYKGLVRKADTTAFYRIAANADASNIVKFAEAA